MKTRAEKAAETRKKNLEKSLADLGEDIVRKKTVVKKKKKEMSASQKIAAAERLEKARAAKKQSNASVHDSIRDLDQDHPLSPYNVKAWIKSNKEHLKSIRHYEQSNDRKERSEFFTVTNYIKNLTEYLRSGVYLDLFYGERRQNRIGHVCLAEGFDKEGQVKRDHNTFYRDIGLYLSPNRKSDAN